MPIDVLNDVQLQSPVVVVLQHVPSDVPLRLILPDILQRLGPRSQGFQRMVHWRSKKSQ